MLDKSSINLIYLQNSGLTHNDLKKIFPTKEDFDPIHMWEWLLEWNMKLDINTDRFEKIQKKAKEIDAEKVEKFLKEKEVDIVSWYDIRYPSKMKNIRHAPFLFSVRWTFLWEKNLMWIVGSRKNTQYSKKILEKLIPDMVGSWMGIISGWAIWVDTLAHEITLKNNWYTIVVLWTGIDRAYPANNKTLFELIIKNGGAVISQFPLGMWPELYNFPIRNETVAGLSRWIIIPEAGLSSGTMITAQLALEHGRDVFAVPGDIDRASSEGTNMLIASWQAKCTRCSGDILEEYFDLVWISEWITPVIRESPKFENEEEKEIYKAISNGYKDVENISKNTKYEISDLLIHLSMLEISWHITLDEMGKYQIL